MEFGNLCQLLSYHVIIMNNTKTFPLGTVPKQEACFVCNFIKTNDFTATGEFMREMWMIYAHVRESFSPQMLKLEVHHQK